MLLRRILCLAGAAAASAAAGSTCSATGGQCEASPKPAAALQGAFSLSQKGKFVKKVSALALEEDDLPDELGAAKAASAAGTRSSATGGISLGQTRAVLGRVAYQLEEDPELVSLGQMGRPAVLASSRLKESLVELSDEALLSEDCGPEELERPAAPAAPKAVPTVGSAPPEGAAAQDVGVAAEERLRALLAAAALALWAGAGAALWARRAAAKRQAGSDEAPEDVDDPLDEGSPPLTAEECMRYCSGREPLAARRKTAADQWGCTPLHVAAGAADASEVRHLLRCGEDVDALEAWDETPLHVAARAGCADACEALLAAGARVNAANSSERTPLVEAALAGHEAVCHLLLERGGHAGGISDAELPPLLSALFVSSLVEGMPAAVTVPPEIAQSDTEEDDDEAFAPQD